MLPFLAVAHTHTPQKRNPLSFPREMDGWMDTKCPLVSYCARGEIQSNRAMFSEKWFRANNKFCSGCVCVEKKQEKKKASASSEMNIL